MEKFIEPIIYKYINEYIRPDNPYLKKVQYQGKLLQNHDMSVGTEVGKLLGLLVTMKGATRVLEMGTCLGYSSIWLGTSLKETGGRLISIEYDRQFCEITKKNVAAAGLDEVVEVIHGDTSQVIQSFTEPFDIIFQDSDKSLYPRMIDDCVRLLPPGGVLITDDTLFKPMGVSKAMSEPIENYNQLVNCHDQLRSTILPIGSGITLSIKI
ncbi:O-methyltransferase [Paenibacillus sp. NPDC057934]|uniref:O-methyltransferase n=1 Tax=Paenibacillus sp. NPDC057934 TaxID=3346282 RepID=UPI0036D84C93